MSSNEDDDIPLSKLVAANKNKDAMEGVTPTTTIAAPTDVDDKPLSSLKNNIQSVPVVPADDEDDLPLATIVANKKRKAVVEDDDIKEVPTPDQKKKESATPKPDQKKAAVTPAKPKTATPAKPKTPVSPATKPVPKTPEAAKKPATNGSSPGATATVKVEDGKQPAKRKPDSQDAKEDVKKPKTKAVVKKEEESDSDSDSDSDSSSSSDSDSSSSDSSSSSSSSSSSGSDAEEEAKKKPVKVAPETEPAKKKEPAKKSVKKEETKEVKKEVKKETKKEVKKETKKKKTPAKGKKGKDEEESGEEEEGGGKKGKGKKKKEEEQFEYKWWLEEPLPEGKKWRTLEHNGVLFPPPYKPHGVKMLYNGEPVTLTPEQEELATYYAQYIESEHVKKDVFRKNFFGEFLKVLNPKKKKKGDKGEKTEKHKIQKLESCDFRPIHKYLMEQREAKKARGKEERDKEKEEKKSLDDKYGIALVDGHKQKISNFRVEPPGLFLGRGQHPNTGILKKRIMPEDITLNLGKDAPIPECPVAGHKWGAIVHNDEVAWLAYWKDTSGNFKYVWLAPSSRVKGESDMKKFETARRLKKHIGDIREEYNKELKSKDIKIRQRATAIYIIDHLALRVGNEKDEDEADTVGCCSLRKEHIKLHDGDQVEFDFLGKDSMRYHNVVKVPPIVAQNIKMFMNKKDDKDDLFDELTTSALNAYLKSKMEGLTAKVFRTYNASITLERELEKMPDAEGLTVDEKMLFYLRANREVAILCNHQRSVSKNFGEQMGKIDKQIEELEDYQADLEAALTGKKRKKPKKKEEKKKEESSDEENGKKKKDKNEKEEKKERTIPDDPDKIKKAITRVENQIKKWKAKKTEKDENKAVSLTTSKINYIDPRVSVAWAKQYDVPIEKIFSKALRSKFPWAMDVNEDWQF